MSNKNESYIRAGITFSGKALEHTHRNLRMLCILYLEWNWVKLK